MSGELFISTGRVSGGGASVFTVGRKSNPAAEIEVRIADVPTFDKQEVKALLWHIAEKIVADDLPSLHKAADRAGRAAA